MNSARSLLPILKPVSRRSTCLNCQRSAARRYLQTDNSKPHAYLRPLINDGLAQAEELEGVMSLVLDRPESRNAVSMRMMSELREGVSKVSSQSSARILLLHAPHQGMFCSGADLRERKSMSPSQVSTFLDDFRSLLSEIESLKIPTIAVVDGLALGGGTELSLAFDMRVGGKDTIFALPEVKLGIIPGAGGTQRVSRLLGKSKGMELIFTGKRVNGEEAERIGLLNMLARQPHSAMDEAVILCRQIITSAPISLAVAKQSINASTSTTLEEGLDLERKLYDTLLDTEDRQEGLRAFAEKRKAVFKGR